MSDKAWGEVDKTTMRDKIMEANSKATLVKAVYMALSKMVGKKLPLNI